MPSPNNCGMDLDRLGRIRSFMQQYVDDGKLAGIVTLVARHGEVVHLEAVGMADLESSAAMASDTIFRIYSMTKPITSVAVMMLHEQGRVLLSAPASTYIPAFADLRVYDPKNPEGLEPERPMTVRDLLMHTAGLAYWRDHPVAQAHAEASLHAGTLGEMIRKLGDLPLRDHPGTVWRYGRSTDVLGYLVEVVSGLPFDEYLAQKIFTPLGMADTAFYVPEDKRDRFAAIYIVDTSSSKLAPIAEAPVGPFLTPPAIPFGGAGLVSTAPDYYRFAQMLLNGGELDGIRLLGRKTVEMMTCDHLRPDMTLSTDDLGIPLNLQGLGFGLGFSVVRDAAQTGTAGTDGTYSWGGAATTWFWVDPRENLVGMIMTQMIPMTKYPIADEFRALMYQALVD